MMQVYSFCFINRGLKLLTISTMSGQLNWTPDLQSQVQLSACQTAMALINGRPIYWIPKCAQVNASLFGLIQRFHGNAPSCCLLVENLPTVYINSPGSTCQNSAKCLASLPKFSRLQQKCHNCQGQEKKIPTPPRYLTFNKAVNGGPVDKEINFSYAREKSA